MSPTVTFMAAVRMQARTDSVAAKTGSTAISRRQSGARRSEPRLSNRTVQEGKNIVECQPPYTGSSQPRVSVPGADLAVVWTLVCVWQLFPLTRGS